MFCRFGAVFDWLLIRCGLIVGLRVVGRRFVVGWSMLDWLVVSWWLFVVCWLFVG